MFAKKHRSPKTSTGNGQRPKTWNPRDLAQAPVRKATFPAKTLEKDIDSKDRDIDKEIEEDQRQINEAIRTAKTPEQLKRARKAAEYISQVSIDLGTTNRHPICLSKLLTNCYLLPQQVKQARSKMSDQNNNCLLYTSPSPRDKRQSRMPSSA